VFAARGQACTTSDSGDHDSHLHEGQLDDNTEPRQPSVAPLAQAHPDHVVVMSLLAGDEQAFRVLVHKHHRAMLAVAQQFVSSRAVAEEVVQDTWLAVVKNLPRFEGRSSLKTWLFTILSNQARTRGVREQRTVPFSSMVTDDGPTIDPNRFNGAEHRWPGHWASPPQRISDLPAERVDNAEVRAAIEHAIQGLPAMQQRVIWLRDVEGWSAEEVCTTLELSEANQRVLLHRARAKVRGVLELFIEAGAAA
jgi:RNA polymerase sigma-70 factor, ECF subfamily